MFISKIKSDSGDRSSWGGFFFNPVPSRSGHVTPDSALQLSAVYACVRVLTDTISTLPFTLIRVGADGSKTYLRDHWLYRLLAKRPNDYMNPMEFMEVMTGHLVLRGNAFALIEANARGEVTDLHPIHPDLVSVEMLSNTNWRFRVKNLDGTYSVYSRGDIFHIKGLSPNGVMGYNPIELARKMLSTGAEAQDYGLRYFQNDASPSGGWIEHPSSFKDKDQKQLFRDAWQEAHSGANKGKVAILEYGMKYHDGITVKNSDAQFIETKRLNRGEIASIFRIPPHMIGDLERATFSNIEQQSIDFVVHALRPWLVRWEEAIKFNFLDVEDDSLTPNYPVISLLRGDSKARSDYINMGIMNGTLTRNEGRLMEDRNPLPGLDEPLRMLNMVTETDAREQQDDLEAQDAFDKVADAAEDEAPEAPEPKQPNPADARMAALASAVADRVARKEVEMVAKAVKYDSLADSYWKHVDFVAGALAVDLPTAQSYCMAQLALVQASGAVDYAQVRGAIMALATGAPVNVIATAPDPALAVMAEQIAQLTGKADAMAVLQAKMQAEEKPVPAPVFSITNEIRMPEPVVPIVHVAAPAAQPAPVVHITNEVNVPEQAAPVVHVAAPAITVNNDVQPASVDVSVRATMPVRVSETDIERDSNNNIIHSTTVERDA
jgi:HK97 family phage portal protein